MKTSAIISGRLGRLFCNGWLTALLLAALPLAARGQAAGSFVQALQFPVAGAHTVDTRVDNSVGTLKTGYTYVLAADDSGHAYLRKFDATGLEAAFALSSTSSTNVVTIPNLAPASMAVVPGTNQLFIVGGSKIFQVNSDNGTVVNSRDLLPSGGLSLQSVYWNSVSNTLYVCGNFTGSSRYDALGGYLNQRAQQSAVVIQLVPDLSGERGLATFGCDGSGAANTANSVVVDENGEVFVAGHLDTGNFVSDPVVAHKYSELESYLTDQSAGVITSIQSAIYLLYYPYYYQYYYGYNSVATSTTSPTIDFSTSTTEDARRYTGYVFAQNAGRYIFFSSSDDGARLTLDGNVIINRDALQGETATNVSLNLQSGLHSLDYIVFNNQGPGAGRVKWHLPTDSATDYATATDVPAAGLGSSEGYVLKFTPDLTQIESFYSSSFGSNQGGELQELTYKSGFVYGIGYWQGAVDTNMTIVADNSYAGSKNIEILKLDTDLKLKKRATVKNNHDISGYGITVDDSGNVYVTGSQGPASSDLYGSSDAANSPSKSISASQPSIFVAQLNASLNFQWVQTPNDPQPTFSFATTHPRVQWNTALQRAFWLGYFNGTMTMGNPGTSQTLNGPEGFLAVLEPTGQFTERVLLTIFSAYGVGGSQVLPFGGPPGSSNNPAILGVNQKPVIKGVQIAASVPAFIYRNLAGTEIPDDSQDLAETRITCTGYTVGNNVANGTANNYTFTIAQDTIVQFNWLKEYALRVQSDFTDTAGLDSPSAPGHIPGLTSGASGNPSPTVQKHWVQDGDPVIASVDASVDDQNYLSAGLNVRYAVDGYTAYGPANPGAPASTNSSFIKFTGSDSRWQVPQFTMTMPASITYHWKLKIGVQVATTDLKSQTYPLVHVVADPGGQPATQPDGMGSGVFYYDQNTVLEIGAITSQGTTQLQGWYDGDGTVFPGTGSLGNLTNSFTATVSGVSHPYSALYVSQLTRPARVMWNYGGRIFDETVSIGDTVTFNTVNDPAVAAILQKYSPPVLEQVVSGPQGSAASDMEMWDSVGKKMYPLRPGVVMTYWSTTSTDTNDQVVVRLTYQYPASPHYRHIANTLGVSLNVSNSPISFSSIKYTESSTGASVDANTNFTATGPGRSVLLFNEKSSSGRGGTIITPRVRVVQTMNWSDNLPAPQTAIIGRKITSAFDTAGLGTGYIFFPNARYDAGIYTRSSITGPIIPVNLNPTAGANGQLVVVWYENRDQILWPYQAVRYLPAWPTNAAQGLNRIVIASRYGNESVATDGTDQYVVPSETYGTNTYPAEKTFNPARFSNITIYNQPDPTLPGYNPNEEHALLAPSLRSAAIAPQPVAAYALRNGDLNVTNQDTTYTSDPYVLVQFYDNVAQQFRMAVYSITNQDSNLNLGTNSYTYTFAQQMTAGEPVVPFYPLPQVIGATPCSSTYGKDGQPTVQTCFWKDHKGDPWAVSGDSFFTVYYYYPLLPDFWWPAAGGKNPGDCVAFLPNTPGYANPAFAIDYTRNDQTPNAQGILYTTVWPTDVPILKVGETLTYAGGEYQLDNPTTTTFTDTGDLVDVPTPGLPAVVGFAAGQVVFDTLNPTMDDQLAFNHYTARIFPALEERVVSLPVSSFPSALLPANGRSTVQSGVYVFSQLPSSLQKRIFYDPTRAVLGVVGFLNNKSISDPTLTASPPAVYCLEPNVLTTAEKNILDGSDNNSPFTDLQGTPFATAMDTLYNLSRNPKKLDQNGDGVDTAYRVGLEQKVEIDPSTGLPLTSQTGTVISVLRDPTRAVPMQALGPGLAMVANPDFLDPGDPVQISYVTVAENNSDSLGSAPVALHIIKVDKSQRYRGSIQTILSANALDENITLRHTADFGGNADDLVFEWWYRPEDGTTALPPDRQPSPSPWHLFADPSGNLGKGFSQLILKGNPSAPQVLLGDTWFFMRYRHKNETVNGENWEVVQPNGERRCVLGNCQPGIPYDWAGAGNSSPQDLNGDGQPDYIAQLAEGWIKRVLTAINPYETRINDFNQDTPAIYSSIIQQLGAPYSGPVALNTDPNVIQNTGLIQLYQTVLNRGEDLSINLSTPIDDSSISSALELASTRISEFYLLLGNDAYADSMNPAIGYGSDSVEYGNLATTVFAFENQLASRLDEELGLLHGVTANNGTPVFNRLYWNFTHDEGEAAYVMKYNITDINNDGVIDVNDASILYPQGHGDAWGDYLTAERMQYDLLRNPYFNWVSRSEYINSQNVVIPVDYLDERKFAETAAAKAQAGAQIVALTYRSKYVADPRGQWQGYMDTDPSQAWGVDEWARRAGQGAYFDWVTANALLPAVHPNTNYTGIQKIDRTTVTDINTIEGNFTAIQDTMDQVDGGNNPLGLHNGALMFSIDPTFALNNPVNTGSSSSEQGDYFDQVYSKAVVALGNAKAAYDNANQYNNLIRTVANSQASLQQEERDQDLSYRNQLIEIFGTPYPGTIGSGQLYPAGYSGPDLALYNYVGVNNVNDSTVPAPSQAFLSNLQNETSGSDAKLVNGWGLMVPIPSDWISKFNLTLFNGTTATVNYADFSSNTIPASQQLQNLSLPVMANGYSYVAPSSWGVRASVGQLQQNIAAMVEAQADLEHEISTWQQIQGNIINQLQFLNQKTEWDSDIKSITIVKDAIDAVSQAAQDALDETEKASDDAGTVAKDAIKAGSDMIPTMTPEVGLADSAGDVLAPARGGTEEAGVAAEAATDAVSLSADAIKKLVLLGTFIADQSAQFGIDYYTRLEEILPAVQELQTQMKAEADQRVAVFKAIQVLTSAGNDYRTTLANGGRLLQERSNYNKKIAAQNQQAQYEDVMFRFSRNSALEQYRSTFDLASRYAYLAASAYDYDLNLSPDDPGSPISLMTDIVHQRSIGLVDDGGTPQVGGKGLAEDLAKLKANYDTLGLRMGLVNPLQENQTFSLRTGCFRILLNADQTAATNDPASDAMWQQTLWNSYVTNLWDVPEFRTYCRQFAPETNGPQPGLVLSFSTKIQSGQNFFGWPLGGGDVSYDPSVYTTRIASTCVGLAGYDTTSMSATPRVYLIPVGADVMTIPNSINQDTRMWNVYDQNIPLPYPATTANFSDPNWRPMIDTVTGTSGTFGDTRQFSSVLANTGPGVNPASPQFDFSSDLTDADRRLIGRSVWNTKWLLIIPGATLNADPAGGLQNFINSVNDIQLNFSTYGYSGN